MLSVTELNREARSLLEDGIGVVWVEGELSNLARPSSGHLYWTLKDRGAQVRCAMFRQYNRRLGFALEDGLGVRVQARVSLYEARGDYQLIVERAEPAGEGLLRQRFEALKRRLDEAGLFDAAHKLPLPALPSRIGVLTSPSGAAIRDVLKILRERFPAVPVRIYPVPVQGAAAAPAIVAALGLAGERRDCEVLVLTRGGGSLEDLWAFNEESVAHAIFACPIPTVAAIGHEVDITIADLVADVRAPTPTGAAELVVPNRAEWLRELANRERRLNNALGSHLDRLRTRASWLSQRLRQTHPGRRLQQQGQGLDELERRLIAALRQRLSTSGSRLARHILRLHRATPAQRLDAHGKRLGDLRFRLQRNIERRLEHQRRRLDSNLRALQAVSPLATLERGYAIVGRPGETGIIRNAAEVATGDQIRVRLARGELEAQVSRSSTEE